MAESKLESEHEDDEEFERKEDEAAFNVVVEDEPASHDTQAGLSGEGNVPPSNTSENMTSDRFPFPARPAWLGFVSALRPLIGPRPDNRPLDQYLELRDRVFASVQSESFLNALDIAWANLDDRPEARDAFLLELQAFPRAVEVAQTVDPKSEGDTWKKLMIRAAGETAGSAKELLDNLPPPAKAILVVFKEVIDIFKG